MSKFKDPCSGNFYTQSLFLELSYADTSNCIYTLKEDDYEHNGTMYPSIKKIYMEVADPTEYAFATKCFSSWSHWRRICDKTRQLHPYIADWRDELEVMLRSQGVRGVMEEALSGGKASMQASKWLADKGWTEKRTAGRPTKGEVEVERKQQASVKSVLESDLARVINVQH